MVHTSTATVTAVRRELCLRKVKNHNNNNIMNVMCYVGLVYPRPHFGLLSRGEAVRNEPAQYISMLAPETTVVVPNGSHYRDSQLCTMYML